MTKQSKERGLFALILLAGVVATWFRFGSGAGNYWDGIFPYWGEQIPTWVASLLSSWNQTGLGSPIAYTTGSLVTILYLPLYYLFRTPELILFITVASLLFGAAYGVFLLVRRVNPLLPFWAAALLGILSVVNPAIFYKLLAGHLYYLVGYFGFIYLLLSLFSQITWTKRSTVLLGLLLALTASQIQFFVFSIIAVITWWALHRRFVHYKYLLGAFGLALVIHSYWISGFIFGIHNISGLSQWASQNSFGGLSGALYQNIVRLNFSDGTFINRFFSGPLSLAGLTLVALLPLLLSGTRRVSKTTLYFLILFVIFVFLSTGVFHQYNIPIIGILFPMLREVGHVAPLVVLSLVLAIGSIGVPQPRMLRALFSGLLGVIITINLVVYWQYIPRVNFDQARAEFNAFYEVNKLDSSTHRLLSYPFFNQYRFINQDQTVKMGTPMSNSGWDSFTIFSGKEYVDNAIQADPNIFQESIQYRFITSYDTDVLRPYNVKYIYDYSKIYESYIEDFSAKSVYGGDNSVVQNDPDFIKNILNRNTNAVEVSPGVVQLKDVLPRVVVSSGTFTKVTPTEYRVTLPGSSSSSIEFLTSFHPGWKLVKERDASKAVTCQDPVTYENGTRECVGQKKVFSGDELRLFLAQGSNSGRSSEFDYANSWSTAGNDNDQTTYTIFFTHQARYMLFMLLSAATVLTCLLYLLVKKAPAKLS